MRCPNCGYPETKEGNFKGVYELGQKCPHCQYAPGVMYTKVEREEMIAQMESASKIFYRLAQKTNVHQFLEVTGFLNELIKAYRRMHEESKDFGTAPLEMKPHEMEYIADKIDCIFGEALGVKANREAFIDALAKKGGWTWR